LPTNNFLATNAWLSTYYRQALGWDDIPPSGWFT
jgi:hypothetical protein